MDTNKNEKNEKNVKKREQSIQTARPRKVDSSFKEKMQIEFPTVIVEAEWEKVSAEIEPELMKTYITIRENRGTAVAGVNDAVCQGCHLNIPPQMYNELQRCDSLKFCPHCQRIIYWMTSKD